MKSFLQRCILLFLAVNAYTQDKPLHVYIEDAETGSAILDAVVAIEGFGLLPIAGKFNKDSKNYFFEFVPEGYNTVIACHDKYTEKGFQAETLPATIELKLYEPNFVSYDFQKPVLTDIHEDYNDNLPRYQRKLIEELDEKGEVFRPTFRFFYEEDPYHIAIISKLPDDKFFSNDSIKQMLQELTLVRSQSDNGDYPYPNFCFDIYGRNLINGNQGGCGFGWPTQHVYFFHKKDSSKFSRFNSPEIKRLREAGVVVAAMAYRKLEYYGKKRFDREFFYEKKPIWYTSIANEKVAVVNNYSLSRLSRRPQQTLFSMFKTNEKYKYIYQTSPLPQADEDHIYSLYFVFPTDDKKAIGLGVLDIATEADYEAGKFFSNTYKE